jgi:hypothetical protein
LGAASNPFRRLIAPQDGPSGARLEPEGSPDDSPYRQDNVMTVAAAPLDHLAARAPDLVKLDIPGSEQDAWAGMQHLLEANPAIRILLLRSVPLPGPGRAAGVACRLLPAASDPPGWPGR